MHDLAEHTNTLLSIIGALFTLIGFLIWNKLKSIERMIESYAIHQAKCQAELPLRYVLKEELKEHTQDFKQWQFGRNEIWAAINKHEHDPNGKVIR